MKYQSDCLIDTKINAYTLETDLSELIGEIDTGNSGPDFHYILCNKDLNEELILLFQPGRIRNHCSYFTVKRIDVFDSAIKKVNCEHFTSGSGIMIGCDIEQVKSRLNMNFIDAYITKDTTILNYWVDLNNEACFDIAKKYNMPLYSAKYVFIKNVLIEFEFGFPYP